MKKILTIIFYTLLFVFGIGAQVNTWQPSPGHTQLSIWSGKAPDTQDIGKLEKTSIIKNPLVAGKPWIEVANVSKPTMTVYSPKRKNTGVAMVVFPGGGYQILAIALEGTEICDW